MRILPGTKIIDLPVDHPMFSILYRVNPLPQIPSLGSWQRTRQDSEIGPSTVHYYGVFDHTFGAKGYALGVNVAVWVMTHAGFPVPQRLSRKSIWRLPIPTRTKSNG
jgi:hypothetical protein